MADKVFLAHGDVMCHLMFDVPPDPYYDKGIHQESPTGVPTMNLTREYPGEYQMSCITRLLGGCNVAEDEHVET